MTNVSWERMRGIPQGKHHAAEMDAYRTLPNKSERAAVPCMQVRQPYMP